MKYEEGGVKYVKGFPACHLDSKLCGVEKCRYWISSMEFGNCVCRVDRRMTLNEVGIALGLTRERVRQIEEKTLVKLKKGAPGLIGAVRPRALDRETKPVF